MSDIWTDATVVGAVRLPTAAIVVAAVLGAVQLVLFIWALVDLIRRPRTTLLPRWVWLVLMIVFELLGPIFYLALGRGEPQHPADPSLPAGGMGSAELDESRTQRAVDMLYGPRDAAQSFAPEQEPSPSGDPQSKPSQWASPSDESQRDAALPSDEGTARDGSSSA